jgi:pyridoxal phosphate-dependent aminotransferase EpsN
VSVLSNRLFLSPPHRCGEEFELIRDVFASNWIAPIGPMLTAFEERLSTVIGIAYVVGFSSGTAALHVALRLCGVGPGDEVWGSTLTFIGGVAPIIYQGAEPVFFDVGPDMLIDLDLLEAELGVAAKKGKLLKVLVTTDLYGHVPNLSRIERLVAEYGFDWISDSAEALGSTRDGRHAGKGARFAILSFNGNKIITTSGGGALASDDPDQIRQAQFLSTQARAGFGFTDEANGLRSNCWVTTVVIDPRLAGIDREHIRLALEKRDIESRPLWKPIHQQPVFANARMRGGTVAEEFFANWLCLPSGSAMTDTDIERVVATITAALP